MPRKKPKKDTQPQNQQPSLLEIAGVAKEKISVYTKSDKEEDKLLGFNVVLTLCSLAFILTGYVYPNSTDLFVKIFALCVFGILAAIASIPYLYLIEMITDLIKKDIFALKLSVALLICVFNLTFLGLFLNNQKFLEYGFFILFIQIILLIVIGFLKIPVHLKIEQSKTRGSSLGTLVWTILDKISIIGGVISLIIWIISLAPMILAH